MSTPLMLSQSPTRRSYRTDIDGLRGLAIALVVFFHVFVGRVSSGVDVFLLIGGIFFFGPQIRSALSGKSLTVIQTLIRLLRRLFPALVTVVLVSMVLVWGIYTEVRWGAVGKDAIASLLYIQNFNLAAAGQDYAAIGSDVSIFQHIWSMSVQLQIYIGSILVIMFLGFVLRRKPWAKKALVWLLIAATVTSFIVAIIENQINQGWNYYSPLSRFWEIGLGGLFGMKFIQSPIAKSRRSWRLPVGIVGLGLIGFTGLFLDGAQQFPGPLTLIPLAGAALVIWSCNPETVAAGQQHEYVQDYVGGVAAMLRSPIPQFLGKISYSLYLWHWPLLAIATYAFAGGGARVNVGGSGITATLGVVQGVIVGVAVIAISILLAWATLNWVEVPTRQKTKPRRSWVVNDVGYIKNAVIGAPARAVGAVLTAACTFMALFGGVWMQEVTIRTNQVAQEIEYDPELYPGPDAILHGVTVEPETPLPAAVSPIEAFYPRSGADGCPAFFEDEELILTKDSNESSEPCAYGDVESDRTMYLFGNSHADHFLPALDVVGREYGIKVFLLAKLSCFPGGGPVRTDGADYPECDTWVDKAMNYMRENPPTDGVFLISTRPTPTTQGPEASPLGLRRIVEELNDADIKVWALRDNPWPQNAAGALNVRLCVAEGSYDPNDPARDCGTERGLYYLQDNPAVQNLEGLNVTHVDLADAFCNEERCPGVIGNVLVYRDASHVTNLYSQLLGPTLGERMFPDGQLPPLSPAGEPNRHESDNSEGAQDSPDGEQSPENPADDVDNAQ